MHPCFWPIRGTPLCASRLLPGESALGIRAAAIRGPLGGPVEGWWLTLFSPVEDSPSSRCCVTDRHSGAHTHCPTTLSGPVGQTRVPQCGQLVSPGFSWGDTGGPWGEAAQKLGSAGPAVGLKFLPVWPLGSGGCVPRAALQGGEAGAAPCLSSF